MMLSLYRTFKFMLEHPIGRRKPFAVMNRWFRWQFGSRILGWPVICPFVGQSRLIVSHGMHGATMNLYVGLHEFNDMSFVVHALRSEDLFVDVGANVGTYSVLAGGIGAQVIAVEPVPSTFEALNDNIRLNCLEDQIFTYNMGLASKVGELLFSTQHGPKNQVINVSDCEPGVITKVNRLEHLLQEAIPCVVKIDVEGYEMEVLKGAQAVLSQPELLAVILELNGSGERYGFDDDETDAEIRRFGFKPAHYEPFKRKILSTDRRNTCGNTLYIRPGDVLPERLKKAPKIDVLGVSV